MSKDNKNEVKELRITADPLSKFHMDEDELRLELVKAQYALRETRQQGQATGLLVLVNGMEYSGKGAAVTQLRQWVDPRLLNVEATNGTVPSHYEPIWQAHVTKLPRHGNITAYFGNWYADLIEGALLLMKQDKSDAKKDEGEEFEAWEIYLRQQLNLLAEFEADLINNHTKLLKCWFHIDEETLKYRIKDDKEDPEWLYHMDWQDKKKVKRFNKIAKVILSQQQDWVVIDGSDPEDVTENKVKKAYKDQGYNQEANLQFCHEVLHATQNALLSSQQHDSQHPLVSNISRNINAAFSWADVPDKLTDIDDPDMGKSDYQKALAKKQSRLAELLRARANKANQKGDSEANNHHVIFAFEGMDAAGKGGAIKRLVAPLDPREYQIYNISAPNQMELQHPYLWRFWKRLPEFSPNIKEERLSRIAIFDRTWYGRVLVERIEGFASEQAWQRAYEEINRMERDLAEKGTIIIKYWLAIDKQEQLERFEGRKDTPHKQFKLTEDDWRNRDKWQDYVQAAADMLARTNTKYAPWHVVATNDKRTARLAVLDHAIAQLEKVIKI
ncbi:ATPase [Psychrobacter sanguinis]|uniref:ATPase n=1 Tax=Psychrobacter sanguinis TaxID=861445 RepID=UPI00020C7967|nr:ATPase [Psychrobacter sanguinis]EGK14941.1 polyphosphate:AMP phosphotransferase [Psychrobacter sp. 1501(2011)]MCC3344048.1 ATPase [Psychrobacter sanguinis]MCD9151053.1 ATPase [Psychrobacter sanguinis]